MRGTLPTNSLSAVENRLDLFLQGQKDAHPIVALSKFDQLGDGDLAEAGSCFLNRQVKLMLPGIFARQELLSGPCLGPGRLRVES